jgi:hypothetical protein
LEEAVVHLNAQRLQIIELRKQIRFMQKQIDTQGSRWWKKLWFRIDGWPPWWIVAEKRQWRPWHKRV